MKMEKIINIEELRNFKLSNKSGLKGGNGSQLGAAQMLSQICGYGSYDGYKVTTNKHEYHLLIENGQSCCESWGYFESNDNIEEFIGSKLLDVKLTNTALNVQKLKSEGLEYGFDSGGIQFVDFETNKGVLQIAVYNAHNGYYGHDIIFAKDNVVLKNDVL